MSTQLKLHQFMIRGYFRKFEILFKNLILMPNKTDSQVFWVLDFLKQFTFITSFGGLANVLDLSRNTRTHKSWADTS